MKYSFEYKQMCISLYRQGQWPETPSGVKQKWFRKTIRQWVRVEEACGPEALRPKTRGREWTAAEKYALVAKVLAGVSIKSTGIMAGIEHSQLSEWVRRYKIGGYQGLITQREYRSAEEYPMKKTVSPTELTPEMMEKWGMLKAKDAYRDMERALLNNKELSRRQRTELIAKLREEGYSLKYLLTAANLSKSTFYNKVNNPDKIKERDKELAAVIKAIFEENDGRYGVRRVYHELLNRGYEVNHKRVQRIMHQLGLKGKCPKAKYRSYKGEVGKIAPNIINRDFTAEEPLKKWSTDVTEFSLPWGKCYLSVIIDMCTNEVISYDLSLSPNMEQIKRMLRNGLQRFPYLSRTILHSDQGWQYQHEYYRTELVKHGLIQSMSRKGNCYDNCIIETFFGRLKNEMFKGQESKFFSFEAFSAAMDKYIDYYNTSRIQEKTNWMPPTKFREASMIKKHLLG